MRRIGVIGTAGGWSSERLAKAFERRTGTRILIDMEEVVLDLEKQRVTARGLDLSELDALVLKKVGAAYSPNLGYRLDLLEFLTPRGVPMFSAPAAIRRALDRLSCSSVLRSNDVPMPATLITEDVLEAVSAVRQFGAAFLKPLLSSKGRGIRLVYDTEDALDDIEAFKDLGNPILYVQQRVEVSGSDICIAFLGGEYLGAYSRVHDPNERRISRKYQRCAPSDELVELARHAQSLFDLDLTYVELIETRQGPLVIDVSAFGEFRSLLDICGVDACEQLADYVLRHLAQS
ncbi:MAG: GAK system ATP-grasp enzyme [Myxococcales bacterium]|nr:GAK system ATP-grasp enzyme [Myxococcales bacterium]